MLPKGIVARLAAWGLVASLVLMLAGSVLPSGLGLTPAFAATSSVGQAQADLARAKKELKSLQAKLDKVAKQQVDAENDLENTRIRIGQVQRKIAATQGDLAHLRGQLAGRLAEMYKNRGSSVEALNMVFSGDDTSLDTVLERLSMVSRIARADSQLIASVRDRVQEYRGLKADLTTQMAGEKKKTARYATAQNNTQKSLEDARSDYQRLQAKVADLQAAARRAEQARKAAAAAVAAKAKAASGSPSTPSVSVSIAASADWVFPVAGPNSFSDSFGAARYAGGYHPHKGIDIFTARATPLVAVEDAVVSSTSPYDTGLGGITIHLKNNRNTTYYYAHLQSVKAGIRPGLRVRAGQVIGYAGNTGDARTTAVHLHFEIRPNGVAVDPYPTLIRYR